MRRTVRILVAVALVVAAAVSASPADRLTVLWRSHGPLVFAAAASVDSGFVPLAAQVLDRDWRTFEIRELAGDVEGAVLDRGFEELRAELGGMTGEAQASVLFDMEVWITCYRALESLEGLAGIEALATAVAMTPAVAEAFPRDRELVDKLGMTVGSSLTGAENSALKYDVATRLVGTSERARAEAVRDLYDIAVAAGAEGLMDSR